MSNNNYSTELIDLKDVIITKVENTTDELHVYRIAEKGSCVSRMQ